MGPPMQRFGGGPNSMAHYQQYPPHSQGHATGLPPPTLGGNPAFMNPNSNINPFAVNGNALSLTQGFGGAGGGMGGGGGTGLASHAAQISFAHGAALQQSAHGGINEQGGRGVVNKGRIREVWKHNLAEEMDTLRRLVDRYPYISMDTEFPGVVARPMGSFRGKSDYHYQTLRTNVDLLKLIQLGITLFTEDGDTTPARPQSSDSGIDMSLPGSRKYGTGAATLPCTWQFNFRFSLKDDMYSQGSIDSLQQAGIDFPALERDGIDPFDFGALLISSGMVCDEDVKWISFHGGYDFGYLTKLMICQPLLDDEVEFEILMKKFFPSIYDVKYLVKQSIAQHASGQVTPADASTLEVLQKFETKPSLEVLAEALKVKRQGPAHQGGSDALLTGKVFFQVRDRLWNGEIPDEHLSKVWGLGNPDAGAQAYNANAAEAGQNGTYADGVPSTPNNTHANMVTTPAPATSASTGAGSMTPGGGGGVFGAFQFGK
ncbi:hypothetical protein VE01_09681 [Pseudogymnoascus verrucosus]|uniref:poly(A)-specific ribonuclease n=1 Tax=Pseudogymnoascus verrucosus TaxID=342668 RepID=A0A1B8GA31_9PEZI|nr:uncharacterized protein VE01_09681 [Pseudogymnoascus verrucosus]OBT92681.1 hypothetical protein VE01_09681 [Pseudogymnoascus verrucosus]